MIKIGFSEMIDRSSEEVWRFMSDVRNFSKWDRNVLETKITSEGPIGVGTTAQGVVQFLGRKVVDVRITEYEPNRKFALEFISGAFKGAKESFTLESVGGNKTRLTIAREVELRGFWKLVQPIAPRMAKREGREDVANAKRILEAQA